MATFIAALDVDEASGSLSNTVCWQFSPVGPYDKVWHREHSTPQPAYLDINWIMMKFLQLRRLRDTHSTAVSVLAHMTMTMPMFYPQLW